MLILGQTLRSNPIDIPLRLGEPSPLQPRTFGALRTTIEVSGMEHSMLISFPPKFPRSRPNLALARLPPQAAHVTLRQAQRLLLADVNHRSGHRDKPVVVSHCKQQGQEHRIVNQGRAPGLVQSDLMTTRSIRCLTLNMRSGIAS